MRIIQLTDNHLTPRDEFLPGVDVRSNFLSSLNAIVQEGADLLVLTGDLCATDGDPAIYNWIRQQLDSKLNQMAYAVIAGNHDNSVLLGSSFEMDSRITGAELYWRQEIKGQSIYFLDTAVGSMSNVQKKWLKDSLQTDHQQQVIIFMHHPPVRSLVTYMDSNYLMTDGEVVISMMNELPEKRFVVFCGHYHVEKTICVDNVTIFITPSTYVQIDQKAPKFQVDHRSCAYRIIDISDNGRTYTTVRYLDFIES